MTEAVIEKKFPVINKWSESYWEVVKNKTQE